MENWRSKPRAKRSRIWLLPTDELQKVVNASNSLSEVLRSIGIPPVGGNHSNLKRRCAHDQIDIARFALGLASNKGRKFPTNPVDLNLVLTENSSYSRHTLKKRLLTTGLLSNKCAICGQLSSWNSKPLVMVLDHINGVRDDNRLENLRLLCPNCNSQTETFAGKSKRRYNG